LQGENPDIMLHYLCECGALNEVFPGLNSDPDLSKDFVNLGLAMKETPQSLGVESNIIMLLLVPYFGKHYLPETHESWIKQQLYLLKHLKLSSLSVKIFMNIIDEELNLKKFLSLTEKDKLDCLYRLDFFRRPNIILEILNIIKVLYKPFEKNNSAYDDLNKFLARFADEIHKLKSELDNSQSGDEIKKFIYQERLSVLKKISQ